jgi:Protein of unknown function (DUF3093)
MRRYTPSRQYMQAGVLALALALIAGWLGLEWPLIAVASVLFLLSAAFVFWLALRPALEINEAHLKIGQRVIPWNAIRRVDRTGWVSPLALHLTLADEARVLIIYPGSLDNATRLLQQIRRMAREALIDGMPHRQFWGEHAEVPVERKVMPAPKYQLLNKEDEEEVERLFQRLKTVGHIEPKTNSDEK